MVNLSDTEKQQIFLGLNKIAQTMAGLKNDLLLSQTALSQNVQRLEEEVMRIDAELKEMQINGPNENNA